MMEDFADRLRERCARCAVTAGKWLLTLFVGVAAFALAAQALAMVLAALALLLAALCLAALCMPEESRAVWVWMRETLGGWSRVAGTEKGGSEAGTEGGERAADSAPGPHAPKT